MTQVRNGKKEKKKENTKLGDFKLTWIANIQKCVFGILTGK